MRPVQLQGMAFLPAMEAEDVTLLDFDPSCPHMADIVVWCQRPLPLQVRAGRPVQSTQAA